MSAIKLENLTKYIEKEYSNEILEQVEINIKYEGYIKKSLEEATTAGSAWLHQMSQCMCVLATGRAMGRGVHKLQVPNRNQA